MSKVQNATFLSSRTRSQPGLVMCSSMMNSFVDEIGPNWYTEMFSLILAVSCSPETSWDLLRSPEPVLGDSGTLGQDYSGELLRRQALKSSGGLLSGWNQAAGQLWRGSGRAFSRFPDPDTVYKLFIIQTCTLYISLYIPIYRLIFRNLSNDSTPRMHDPLAQEESWL